MIVKLFEWFGVVGVTSILLWVLAIGLWVRYFVWVRDRWMVYAGVVLAVAALMFAEANSLAVSRIELDRSAERIAAAEREKEMTRAEIEAMRRNASRVRFAEDSAADRLDVAGTEKDADRIEKSALELAAEQAPDPFAYRKEGKVEREAGKSRGLEEVEEMAEKVEAEEQTVRKLPEPDYSRANRLDIANLRITRIVLLLAIGMVLLDYLLRFRGVFDDVFPLPMAGRWLDAVFPKTRTVLLAPGQDALLKWFIPHCVRKGETFVYFGPDDPLPGRASLPRLQIGDVEGRFIPKVLRPRDASESVDKFLWETVWFGRCGFVVAGDASGRAVMRELVEFLEHRFRSRAKVRRTVNVIWHHATPPDEQPLRDLLDLAPETNYRLIVCAELPEELAGRFEMRIDQQLSPSHEGPWLLENVIEPAVTKVHGWVAPVLARIPRVGARLQEATYQLEPALAGAGRDLAWSIERFEARRRVNARQRKRELDAKKLTAAAAGESVDSEQEEGGGVATAPPESDEPVSDEAADEPTEPTAAPGGTEDGGETDDTSSSLEALAAAMGEPGPDSEPTAPPEAEATAAESTPAEPTPATPRPQQPDAEAAVDHHLDPAQDAAEPDSEAAAGQDDIFHHDAESDLSEEVAAATDMGDHGGALDELVGALGGDMDEQEGDNKGGSADALAALAGQTGGVDYGGEEAKRDLLRVRCPSCRAKLGLPKKAAGRVIKCPRCKSPMEVPRPEGERTVELRGDKIITRCPSCEKRLGVARKFAGRMIRCPACSDSLRVPYVAGEGQTPASSTGDVPDATPKRKRSPKAVIACPHCDATLGLRTSLAGRTVNCPKCKGAIALPDDLSEFVQG